MGNQRLAALEQQRKTLALGITDFNTDLEQRQLTGKVEVDIEGKRLDFEFEAGKVKGTPPTYAWAKGWSWADFRKYCKVHRYQIKQG